MSQDHAKEMKAKAWGSHPVVTIERSASVASAARRMREKHVGGIVVVDQFDDGEIPVGVVTDRDLVIECLAEGLDPNETKVEDIMSDDIITANETSTPESVIHLMQSNGIRRIPLINDRHFLTAIVTLDDLLERDGDGLKDLRSLPKLQRNWERNIRA
jgi:CBS domain-containing protein